MDENFNKVIAALNLTANAPDDAFFDAGLKHQERPDLKLSSQAAEIYQALQAIAL